MKIAVIGAGFTGLSATWNLLKKGHQVTLYEKESQPGGLAIGFTQPGWEWSLEKHYHHIFTSDHHIQRLATEIGQSYHFYDAKTYSLFLENDKLEFWRLDSPLELLKFGKIPILDRVRMGAALAYLKYAADWKQLEKVTAADWLPRYMGQRGYETLWLPLFKGKFATYYPQVNMAWFWARVKSRSKQLGYFDGGFLGLAQSLLKAIETKGGVVRLNTPVASIESLATEFDKVIIAGAPNLVKHQVDYLGTINIILQLKEKFLPHDIYWLNMNLPGSPILAIVEHTNMIDKKHYDDQHLVYLAKYLPHDHEYFTKSDEELLKEYSPILDKINPKWQQNLISFTVHRAKYTQPVMPINYSQHIPGFQTDNPKVLAASMQQVYPWDRGTNFAVELGEKLADIV